MKSLYYVTQTLLHSRSSNLIKIISLTLGVTVSILILPVRHSNSIMIHAMKITSGYI